MAAVISELIMIMRIRRNNEDLTILETKVHVSYYQVKCVKLKSIHRM